MTYPLLLHIASKQTVVVGAGTIATRRVSGLLEAGARVRVIAPQATAEIQQWDREHVIDWIQRPYSGPSDIRDAWLVHTATGIPEVDVAVSAAAEKSRIFRVTAADAEVATAHTPVAIIESGWTPAQRTTVATLATAPEVALAREVRNPAIIVGGDVVRLRESLGDLGRISPTAGHVRAGILQDR